MRHFSNGQAQTIVSHDHPDFTQTATLFKRDGCEPPGCNKTGIDYGTGRNELGALATLSESCSQSIVHECTNNPLTGN